MRGNFTRIHELSGQHSSIPPCVKTKKQKNHESCKAKNTPV